MFLVAQALIKNSARQHEPNPFVELSQSAQRIGPPDATQNLSNKLKNFQNKTAAALPKFSTSEDRMPAVLSSRV